MPVIEPSSLQFFSYFILPKPLSSCYSQLANEETEAQREASHLKSSSSVAILSFYLEKAFQDPRAAPPCCQASVGQVLGHLFHPYRYQ